MEAKSIKSANVRTGRKVGSACPSTASIKRASGSSLHQYPENRPPPRQGEEFPALERGHGEPFGIERGGIDRDVEKDASEDMRDGLDHHKSLDESEISVAVQDGLHEFSNVCCGGHGARSSM